MSEVHACMLVQPFSGMELTVLHKPVRKQLIISQMLNRYDPRSPEILFPVHRYHTGGKYYFKFRSTSFKTVLSCFRFLGRAVMFCAGMDQLEETPVHVMSVLAG